MSTYIFSLSRGVRLIAGWVLVASVTASNLSVGQESTPPRSAAAEADKAHPQMEGDNVRPAERAFLEMAWVRLRQQRRLGELAVGNASSSAVRSHAQQLTGDMRRLGEGLEGLLRKKGIALLATGESSSVADQQIAEQSGTTFDRKLVQTLGGLHEATHSLFEHAAAELKDADLRDFAAAQLPILRGHRDRMVRIRAAME